MAAIALGIRVDTLQPLGQPDFTQHVGRLGFDIVEAGRLYDMLATIPV